MSLTRREVLQASTAALLLPSVSALALKPGQKKLRVAFFSDSHVAVGRNIKENQAMLAEIAALQPNFCINAGDVTDQGWQDQVDLYLGLVKESGLTIHHTPGNHDVRWSPMGMQIFEAKYGQPYRAFEVEGCWFILLDSTVPLSHWGDIASPQLAWLERTLKLIGREAPVFVFSHHWVGRDVVQIDNEQALVEMFRHTNVRFFGLGHGHNDLHWKVAGRVAIMNRGLYQLSYTILDLDLEARTFTVSKRTVESPKLHEVARESLSSKVKPAEFRSESSPVVHKGKLEEIWSVKLPGGVMSHVVEHLGSVIVSTMDGSVLRFDAKTGKERWRTHLGGYCHSTPHASGSRVFVGSSSGAAYALSLETGKVQWKRHLVGPVYAGPAHTKGIVMFANHGLFYGLNAETGEVAWRTLMPKSNTSFAQSPAVTDGEVFIQGCWDSHLYCLEATTGELRWRKPCQERTFAFSPAIGAPFIDDGHVFVVANGNGLFKFKIASGEKVFEVASKGQKYGHSGPCVVGDRVYVGCLGDGEGEVRCASADNGDEIWVSKTGFTIYDSCARAGNGFITVNSVPGVLNVLRQSSGEIIGQFYMGEGHALSTSAVVGNTIYAASFANKLFALKVP